MKKIKYIITLLGVVLMMSCSSSKDYVTFSGRFPKGVDEITLKSKKAKVDKVIYVDSKGHFKDTIKLHEPSYLALSNGEMRSVVYVKNGDDIKALFTSKNLLDVLYSGKGFEETAYMTKKAKMQEDFFKDSLYYKSVEEFNEKLDTYSDVFYRELAKVKDTIFRKKQKKYVESFRKRANKQYKFKSYIIRKLGKGTYAPDFSYPYESSEGEEEYTLSDFKGKPLYVKFWATWCAYCKAEAPYFKKLSKKYKNVKFVGVSLDQERSKKVWKGMVKKSKYTELFSKNDEVFKKIYRIKDLPRFMLIDANGKIIDADAPSPSSKEIIDLLDKF